MQSHMSDKMHHLLRGTQKAGREKESTQNKEREREKKARTLRVGLLAENTT